MKLIKSINSNENQQKRINIKQISKISDLLNASVNSVKFILNSYIELEKLSKYLETKGKTKISIDCRLNGKILSFNLKNKRFIDQKSINSIKKDNIRVNIL